MEDDFVGAGGIAVVGVGDEEEVVGDGWVQVGAMDHFHVGHPCGEELDDGSSAALGAIRVDGAEGAWAPLWFEGQGVGAVGFCERLFPGDGAGGHAGVPGGIAVEGQGIAVVEQASSGAAFSSVVVGELGLESVDEGVVVG